jgi:hypothetical protein
MKVLSQKYIASCLVSGALAIATMAGCGQASQPTGEPSANVLDPLISLPRDAGFPDSGIFACPACIQSSCSGDVTALETELQSLRTEARTAFECVVSSHCFAAFSIARDAGVAAGRAAVEACVAACDTDAGLPDRDAAKSAVMSLAEALDTCVDTSCTAQCPGAAKDLDDQ